MFDKFSERHIGVSNEKDLKAMLDVIGVKSVDELISQVIPRASLGEGDGVRSARFVQLCRCTNTQR